MVISIEELINHKKTELSSLTTLAKKFNKIKIKYTPNGMIFISSEVNKIVNKVETIIPNVKYSFYISDSSGIRIYSEPYPICVRYLEGYEDNWLYEIEKYKINAKVIVDLMKQMNPQSKYLRDFDYFANQFPYLKKWIKNPG